jgi:GPH family glycoside/pentoside/hexuronide:cation symporter
MSTNRLTRTTLFCYSAGSLVETSIYGFCGLYLMNFYTDVVHLDPRLIGYAFSIRFFADALTDPAVGYLSDRTRTRIGRRRPYFLAGAVPAAVWLGFLLNPPDGTDLYLFVWLTVFSSLLISSLTVFGIPYLALSWELSADYDERTRISAWRRGFEVLAEMLATLMIPVLLTIGAALSQESGAGNSTDESSWYFTGGVLLGGMGIVAAFVAFMGTRETTPAKQDSAPGFMAGITAAYRNRPFVILLITFTLMAVADRVATALLFYLMEYLHGVPKPDTIPFFLTYFAGSLLSPIVWAGVSRRFGKKRTYMVAMLCWAAAFSAFAAVPWKTTELFVIVGLMGAVSSGVLILPGAIIPDVIEWEQVKTGQRREGVYAGVARFSWKLATSVCFLVVGQLLYQIGYDGESPPDAAVLNGLQWMFAVMIGMMAFAAVAVFSRFPITSISHMQHVEQLTVKDKPDCKLP